MAEGRRSRRSRGAAMTIKSRQLSPCRSRHILEDIECCVSFRCYAMNYVNFLGPGHNQNIKVIRSGDISVVSDLPNISLVNFRVGNVGCDERTKVIFIRINGVAIGTVEYDPRRIDGRVGDWNTSRICQQIKRQKSLCTISQRDQPTKLMMADVRRSAG